MVANRAALDADLRARLCRKATWVMLFPMFESGPRKKKGLREKKAPFIPGAFSWLTERAERGGPQARSQPT